MRLVQREPFSSALDAVVEKLGVDLTCPQRCQQRLLDVFRKLAGVNRHLDNRSHKPFLDGVGGEHKISPGLSMDCPFVLLVVLVLVLDSSPSWLRGRGRGRAREQLGSWKASTISESRIGTMNQRRTGARTALSASASDLIRADMAVRAPTAGSWKVS